MRRRESFGSDATPSPSLRPFTDKSYEAFDTSVKASLAAAQWTKENSIVGAASNLTFRAAKTAIFHAQSRNARSPFLSWPICGHKNSSSKSVSQIANEMRNDRLGTAPRPLPRLAPARRSARCRCTAPTAQAFPKARLDRVSSRRPFGSCSARNRAVCPHRREAFSGAPVKRRDGPVARTGRPTCPLDDPASRLKIVGTKSN